MSLSAHIRCSQDKLAVSLQRVNKTEDEDERLKEQRKKMLAKAKVDKAVTKAARCEWG